jgi:hypothetical protein
VRRLSYAVALLLITSPIGCSSDTTSRTNSSDDDVQDASVAATGDDVAESEVQEPTQDVAADVPAVPDVQTEPDVPLIVVPPHDFAATAPWYQCPTADFPDTVTIVDGFQAADQYFGDPNLRDIEVDVDFPEEGSWAQIGLWLQLECPANGKCDHWDRTASVSLVLDPDTDAQQRVEIARHITPYRIGMCQFVDVTNLAPLLRGKQRLHSWIDTWVGPGHAQGEGWRVTTRFVFYPGAGQLPKEVVNVWERRHITVGEIEPDKNVDSQVQPVAIEVPSDAKAVLAHLTTTGHSFGNTQNCAEFCPMRHDLLVNGTAFSDDPWRADCSENPVSPQFGTWEHPRNGWCPGAISVGTVLDITSALEKGATNTLDLDILLSNGAEYDNLSPVDLLPYAEVSLKLYLF